MTPRRTRQPVTRAPADQRVAKNVRRIRQSQGMTTAALSGRLEQLGRYLWPNAITRIEQGIRRVDAGDLMALAVALDVNPNALLLPARADKGTVPLTDQGASVTSARGWEWACGERRLNRSGSPHTRQVADVQFAANTRPHDHRTPVRTDTVAAQIAESAQRGHDGNH